jgi:hypothetical protein
MGRQAHAALALFVADIEAGGAIGWRSIATTIAATPRAQRKSIAISARTIASL